MDVLTLQGILTLDKSQYDKGLADADTGAHSFGGRFSKAMKIGAAAAVGLGIAAGYAGKKLVGGAMDVAKYGDHVDKMSQKIGISSDAYQKWDYVMQRAGGNVDQLKMGMKTLSQQAEKNSDAFQKLGISQEEVKDLNQEELFERTVKGLADMEAGTERTALASQLLGRAGADLGPLLNQGSDAIEEQMEIAEKYGMVMPEEAVKASAAFEDSMTTLQMTAQGLKNRLLGEFLPAMTKVTDGLAKMFTGDMSGLDDVIDGVKEFIGKIGEMAPKVLKAGGKLIGELIKGLIKKIPELLSTGGKLLGKLLEGLQNSVAGAAPVIANIVTAIGNFIASNAPKMIATALALMGALAQGFLKAIPSLLAAIPQLISSIISTFMSFDWGSIGMQVITMIADGISQVGGDIIASAKSVATGFLKTISTYFQAAKDKASSIVVGLATKISAVFNAIKAKATAVWNAIKRAITKPIETAKQTIKKIIETIKGFFPFSIKKVFNLPKLPSISVTTAHKKVGMIDVPYPKLSWNAKAMQNPYLFSDATLFGAGEAGDEILYGRSALMNDIKEAVGGTGTYNYTFNVYATESQSPKEIAEVVRQMIIKEEKRRKVAWA